MGSIAKIGAGAAAALGGLAIGKALFVDPIKSAGEFQQSLNVLQATSHATDARMKEISATAMKLGQDTKLPAVSAADAANAMLELAKGGFSAKESMEAARGVLLLSTAAQIDGATAATMVADGLHMFGMKAKDSSVLVNDFAGAANASTASMSEVGQSLQQSGTAFHTLGIPVGDAATAIAAMANAGIKGSDAGTSLKTMLARLNPETKKAKQAFQDMGVSAYDSNGKFVGMRAVIEQLGPKLAGMTQKQKAHTLATVFGSDASRAAAIVLGMTGAQWDKLHGSVTRAGQAQALADAQTKGFKGAMAGLRSTIETIQLQIGLKLLPVLTRLVQFLSASLPGAVAFLGKAFSAVGDAVGRVAEWLGVFQDKATSGNVRIEGLASSVDNARTRFDAIKDAISGTIGVIREWAGWVSDNVGNVRQIAIAVGMGAAAFVVLTAAVKVYTAVQAALNAVMAANPIGLVIIAIAALVVGLTLLYQRSETARNIMNAVFNTLRAAATAALGFITDTLIPNAIAAWNRFGPGVVSALSSVAQTVGSIIQGVASVVERIVDQIEQNWRGVWDTFGPLVTSALSVIKTIVKTTLDMIAGIVRVFVALLRGDWSGAWNALKNLAKDALNGAVTVIKTILTGLAATALNLAKAVASKIVAGIKTAPGKLVGLGGELVGKIAAAAGEAARAAFNMGVRIADSVISGIGNIAARVANKLSFGAIGGAAANKVVAGSKGGFKTGGGGAGTGGGGGSNDINLQTDSIIAGINFGGKLRAKIKAEMGTLFPPEVGTKMVTDLAAIFNATTTATLAGVGRMTASMSTVRTKLASSLDGLGTQMDAKLQPLIDKIANAPKKSQEKLTAAARAVEKPMVEAFVKWIQSAKAAYDAQAATLMAKVDATFAKAQAKLDVWKAKATPTEALLAARQAQLAQQQVDAAVTAASAALDGLLRKQETDWAKMIATQNKQMAELNATQAATVTNRDIAGHEFEQTLAGADPLAVKVLEARKALDTAKGLYAEQKISSAELFAAQDAFDAASLASADSTSASKLLQDYDTWQGLLTQTAAGQTAIDEQTAANAEANLTAQAANAEAVVGATKARDDALYAQQTAALTIQAEAERTARDKMYETLSAALVKRHDRIIDHLKNVQHAHDLAFDKLAEHAAKSGRTVGENLADGMNRALPTVRSAASALAAVVRQYLKLASPAERGPMSDLDTWWTKLAPTLVASLDSSSIKAALTDATTPNAGTPIGRRGGATAQLPQRVQLDEHVSRDLRELVDVLKRQQTTQAPVTVIATGGADAAVYAAKR